MLNRTETDVWCRDYERKVQIYHSSEAIHSHLRQVITPDDNYVILDNKVRGPTNYSFTY